MSLRVFLLKVLDFSSWNLHHTCFPQKDFQRTLWRTFWFRISNSDFFLPLASLSNQQWHIDQMWVRCSPLCQLSCSVLHRRRDCVTLWLFLASEVSADSQLLSPQYRASVSAAARWPHPLFIRCSSMCHKGLLGIWRQWSLWLTVRRESLCLL